MATNPQVSIVMGSDSDLPVMEDAAKTLKKFGVGYEMLITSAHAVSPLQGVDALLAMGQMPSGIPVATVTIGKAGAKNAALLAVEILALSDVKLQNKLIEYRKKLAKEVGKKNKKLTHLNT